MQMDAEHIRDCVSMKYNPMKCKFRLSPIAKLNFIEKFLHKNEIFQDYDQKLNFKISGC